MDNSLLDIIMYLYRFLRAIHKVHKKELIEYNYIIVYNYIKLAGIYYKTYILTNE